MTTPSPTHRLHQARHAVACARRRHDAYMRRLAREVGDSDVLTPDQRDELERLNAVRERACDELEAVVVALRAGVAA